MKADFRSIKYLHQRPESVFEIESSITVIAKTKRTERLEN
jgi:hypothetical protein